MRLLEETIIGVVTNICSFFCVVSEELIGFKKMKRLLLVIAGKALLYNMDF